jgi:hypothetical protein
MMIKGFGNMKVSTAIMAILLVILMSTGAFIGAAQNSSMGDEDGAVEAILPINDPADATEDPYLDPSESEGQMEENYDDYIDPIIPNLDQTSEPWMEDMEELTPFEEDLILETDTDSIPDVEEDPELPSATEGNSFSSGLDWISEKGEDSSELDSGEEDSGSRASSASMTIVIGADSNKYPGQGNGRIYWYSSTYNSYYYYNMYTYGRKSGYSGSRYKGWAVFDLSDLDQYQGLKVTSGKIVYRQDSRYRATQMDFWTMKSIPYGNVYGGNAKTWYNEIGGAGSVQMGSATFSGYSDYGNKDVSVTISSGGVTDLNTRISASNYDFAMGTEISKWYSSYYYGYIYAYDVRLELTVSVTGMPDEKGEVAVGDELSGYCRSTYMYDIGRVYTSSSYRAFATWDSSLFKSLIPTSGPGGEPVTITGVSLRLNHVYSSGYLTSLGIYHMKYNPSSYLGSPSTVYTDCRDGTAYIASMPYYYSSSPKEYEWDLGDDALDDFNDTLDGSPSFFALGLSRTSSYHYYMQSPKLVIKWKIEFPPQKTIQLGADNPEKDGQGYGNVYRSGTYYNCYTDYRAYIYKYRTSSERHGWATFDLQDIKRWPGAKVTNAQLVVHNYQMSYAKTIKFTSLVTTPFQYPGSSTSKKIFDESSSTGNIIGEFTNPLLSDTAKKTIVIDLNNAAVTALNAKLNSSGTYKTFGVGMFIDALHTGYSTARVYWTDIRLKVSFEYSDELKSTNGKGVAFGDDWNGHYYKYTSPSDRPYGYMYTRKYSSGTEYRSYINWDIPKITKVFDQANLSVIKIKKVGLRLNHLRNSLKSIYIYPLKNNATKIHATDPSTLYTDCGDGTSYYGPGTTGTSYNEYTWDLGANAVAALQDAVVDHAPDFFGVGIVTTATSGYAYSMSPRLVVEFEYPGPAVVAKMTNEPGGYEGTPVFFNANSSRNLSGGVNGLRYEWNWDDGKGFSESSSSPYTNHSWVDEIVVNVTLRVNDTISGKNASISFKVIVLNANPEVNTSAGSISPQPAYEAGEVTFSGFTVMDAGVKDTFKYFWDFDLDGEFDVNGSCVGNKVPSVTAYFDDDYLGEAHLLIVDNDGGSNNLTTKYKTTATPQSSSYWTGYVYNSGTKRSSGTSLYYHFSYTFDYRRSWGKVDLSEIPEDATIAKMVFKGTVAYNYSSGPVDSFGVRLLKSDPVTAPGSTIYSEAGSGTRLFGLTASVGPKTKDMTKWATSSAGRTVLTKALKDGWIAFGFDFETPANNYRYGYMRGYSYNVPALEIEYLISRPGCLIPFNVLNVPPVLNCSNLTITPKTVNEGDIIQVSNISFCDPGNDTYEAKVVIGETFETDWMKLGGMAGGGGSGGGGTMMYIGPHVRTYSSSMTRGYFFQAPTDFTVNGLRIPTDASTAVQNIEIVRFNSGPPPAYSGTTNDFTSLGYWNNVAGTNVINTNIYVQEDDWIGIIGARGTSTMYNSYGGSNINSMIGSYSVTLSRCGFQYNLNTQKLHDIWSEVSGPIGRIEMYYSLGGSTIPSM